MFGVNVSGISRHLANVFASGELDEKSNLQKMQITNSDKPVVFYSLDVIISVGYRVNSIRATAFRKWATSVLKQYMMKGYAVNHNAVSEQKVPDPNVIGSNTGHVEGSCVFARYRTVEEDLKKSLVDM